MTTPRDPSGDSSDDGSGWREPEHLGGSTPPPANPPAADPPAADPRAAWQPPGWDLPSAEPERPWSAPPPAATPESVAPPAEEPYERPSWGAGREQAPPRVGDQVFSYQGDLVGAQGWGMDQGWVASDGIGPQDAVLAELVASAPVRASKDDRPGNVLRGRFGSLDLVAFDVVYTSGRYAQPRWAITAAPVLGSLPGFRLAPARFWKHRTGGLLHLPSGDPEFDVRWVLLAPEDSPQLRRLVDDVLVRQLLLGSDDGDELWSAAGHVAAVRPDGHRPELIEHQGRILTAVVGALAAIS